MARFDLSGFAPADQPDLGAMPPPPSDPSIDTTRVNGALNDFLGAKQEALFDAPDAFYRATGRAAVDAAPAAVDRLEQLRTDTLSGLANDTQRQRLSDLLDAQLSLAREDMGRHVAEQTKAWQRQTAQDRIDVLTREAALHHGDSGLLDTLATAAEVAARAHAEPDEADGAASGARSGIFHAAIQALLDRGKTDDAAAELDRRRDQLGEDHAGALQAQLDTARRFDAARAYADGLVPTEPPATADEIEAQRAAALEKVAADHADDPAQKMLAQHLVESAYDRHRGTLGRLRDDIALAVKQWLALSTGQPLPRIDLPPPILWNRLDPQQQAHVLVQLRLNDGRPTEAEPTPADGAAPPPAEEPTMMSDADPEPMVEGEQYAQAAKMPAQDGSPADGGPIGTPQGPGAAPIVEPLPGGPERRAAEAQVPEAENAAADTLPGEIVVLPDGRRVDDPDPDENQKNKSPTGYMMSPVADLTPVAEAGRTVGAIYRALAAVHPVAAEAFRAASLARYVLTGGVYDYQRRGRQIPGLVQEVTKIKIPGGDFVQRRQFRSVSNFNVGLFSQQAGLSLEETLRLGQLISRTIGKSDQSQAYDLNKKTAEFIKKGYEAGESGAFGSPGLTQWPTGR